MLISMIVDMSKNKTLKIGEEVEIQDPMVKSWKKFPNLFQYDMNRI